jgi:hypothetical protein
VQNEYTSQRIIFFDARLTVRYSTRATARACNSRKQQQHIVTTMASPRTLFTLLTGYSNNQPSTRGPQGDPEGPTDQYLANSSKWKGSYDPRYHLHHGGDVRTSRRRGFDTPTCNVPVVKAYYRLQAATAAYCICSIIAAMIIVSAQFCFVRSVFLFSLQINFLTRKLPGRIRTRFLQEK